MFLYDGRNPDYSMMVGAEIREDKLYIDISDKVSKTGMNLYIKSIKKLHKHLTELLEAYESQTNSKLGS